MQLTAAQIDKAQRYWKDAAYFVRLNSDDPRDPAWFVVSRETPALNEWKSYFQSRLGFIPAGIRMLESGQINQFLVPSERPAWFDGSYGEREEA